MYVVAPVVTLPALPVVQRPLDGGDEKLPPSAAPHVGDLYAPHDATLPLVHDHVYVEAFVVTPLCTPTLQRLDDGADDTVVLDAVPHDAIVHVG